MDTMKDTKMQPAKSAVIEELRKVIADCYWPTSPVAINEILDRLEAAESECLEQARLNGMGGEREAALMAKLEAAEKDIAVKEEVIDSLAAVVKRLDAQYEKALAASALRVAEGWERKCGELRAKIEQMERQEPVGQFIQHPSNGLWEQDGYGDNPDARPLYALPGVKGE